ncbi:MAG: RDD family protein [bacterium]
MEEAEKPAKVEYLTPADIRVRAINYFVDYLLIPQVLMPLLLRLLGIEIYSLDILETMEGPEMEKVFGEMMHVLTYFALAWISYFAVCEIYFQKTLGKMITKTIVVDMDGNKPLPRQIILRTLIRLIPMEFLSYYVTGYILHDEWSKTAVVYEKAAETDI